MLIKDAWYLKSEFYEDLAKEHCHIKLVNPLVHLAIKTLNFLYLFVIIFLMIRLKSKFI